MLRAFGMIDQEKPERKGPGPLLSALGVAYPLLPNSRSEHTGQNVAAWAVVVEVRLAPAVEDGQYPGLTLPLSARSA